MNRIRLIESIKKHEGLELKPYRCTEGRLTIGYGRNLDDKGISISEAEYLLDEDLRIILLQLSVRVSIEFDISFDSLPDIVREVLIELAYQIGVNGLVKFSKTFSYIKDKDYLGASVEMLDSKWAKQTPNRARSLSNKMKEGNY